MLRSLKKVLHSVHGLKFTLIATDLRRFVHRIVTSFGWNEEQRRIEESYIPLTNRVRCPYRKLQTESFPLRFTAQAKSWEKKQGSITYGTEREDEVSKIFIISLLCVWRAQQWFPFMRNSLKFLKQVESKTIQFEIVFLKSLARFSTQFRAKRSFKLLLAI